MSRELQQNLASHRQTQTAIFQEFQGYLLCINLRFDSWAAISIRSLCKTKTWSHSWAPIMDKHSRFGLCWKGLALTKQMFCLLSYNRRVAALRTALWWEFLSAFKMVPCYHILCRWGTLCLHMVEGGKAKDKCYSEAFYKGLHPFPREETSWSHYL